MGDKIKITEKKEKSFRDYRRFTLKFVFLILCVSIWSTMMMNADWRFSDVAFECFALGLIVICGMFGNVQNRFSLFHIRGLRITKERLISVLIGILLPLSFIIYFMVSDNEFMKYLRNISLHDFANLCVLLIPIMVVISLIIYFGYVVLEPKYAKEKKTEYAEKTEKSLDEYKIVCLTFICLAVISSLWLKLSFNYEWNFINIRTEVVVIVILATMKIISNLKNKLPWNYSQRLGYSKYLYVCLLTPYIVFGLACIISPSLREYIGIIGYQKTISLIVLYSPFVGLLAVAVSCVTKIVNRLTEHTKKYGVKQLDKATKHDNIIVSVVLSLLSVMLIFIYILIAVLDTIEVDLLIKTIIMLVPVGIIFYLVIYYSINTINK